MTADIDNASCETLTPARQQDGMRHAIHSACWGALSQVMIRDSSVLIIFAALLGAGDMIGVLTTALMDSAVCLLMIPFAYLCERIGKRRQIVGATVVAMIALSVTATAPWFGSGVAARSILIGGLVVYAIVYGAYVAAWLPLLDGIVPPAQRGLFFGRMRFTWQISAAVFIFLSGWFVGRFATTGRLQIIILLAAVALMGRAWHISRIDEIPAVRLPGWKAVMRDILLNRPLIGFSVYLFFLYAASNSFIPLVFVFGRNALHLADNVIVLLSVAAMSGLIMGYWAGGRFINRYGVKMVFLGAHAGFALLHGIMLAVHGSGRFPLLTLIGAVAVYGALFACASVAVSSELLALAPRVNKAVSIAFGFSLYSAGLGFSRLVTSLILGSGMLAERWSVFGVQFTRYHALFLFFGCAVLSVSVLLVLVPALVRDVERLPGL